MKNLIMKSLQYISVFLCILLFTNCGDKKNKPQPPTLNFEYSKLHVGQVIEIESDLIVKETDYLLYINDVQIEPWNNQDSILKFTIPIDAKHGIATFEYDETTIDLGEVEIHHMYAYARGANRIVEISEYDASQLKVLYQFDTWGDEVYDMVYCAKTNSLIGQVLIGNTQEVNHFNINVLTEEVKMTPQDKLSSFILDKNDNLYSLKEDKLVQLNLENGDIINEFQWVSGDEIFLNPINNTLRLRSPNQPNSIFKWNEYDLSTQTYKSINLTGDIYRYVILEDGKMYSLLFEELLLTDLNGNLIQKVRDFDNQSEIIFSEATQKIYLFYQNGGNSEFIKFNLDHEFMDYSQNNGFYFFASTGTTS